MNRTLFRTLVVAAAAAPLIILTGCSEEQTTGWLQDRLQKQPVHTTPSTSAYNSTEVKAEMHQPDGTYNEVQFSNTQPYGLVSPADGLAAILAEGTGAFLGGSAGPASVGRASQPVALGNFKGDGSPGVAYIAVSSNPNRVTIAFGNAQAGYSTTRSYVTGTNSTSVVAADFNGDGKTDLAVAYGGDGTTPGGVAVLLSNGDGTFAPVVNYAAGASPISLAAYDLNHDGKLDLVVADNGASPGKVYVLLGNGNGTFGPATSFATNRNPLAVTIADFNGDGNPDLAVTAADNSLSILSGSGSGTFALFSTYSTGSNPVYVAAGDFNKDGKLDLAVANKSSQTVSIFLGNGLGRFQTGPSYVTSYEPESLVITDYNGDGNLDIIQGSGDARCIGPGVESGNIDFLFGNGDGTFQGGLSIPVPTGGGTLLATGDFNGDGKTDAVVNDKSDGNLYLFAGNGSGGLQALATLHLLATGGSQTGPSGAAAGDFNNDGKTDLAVTEEFAGKVAVLLNSGSGLQLSGTFSSGGAVPGPIVAADFNGDGKLDLAVVNGAVLDPFTPGNVTVFFGDGHGAFTLAHTYSAGAWPSSIAVADLNGDGKPDLVVTDRGGDPSVSPRAAGAVYVFLNDGHGGFPAPSTITVSAYPYSVWTGDLRGNGKADLIVAAESATVSYTLSVLLGNGNGTFQAPVSVSPQYSPSGVVIGDFSGDGKADLFVSHCCGATDVTYLQGNGDGTFQTELHLAAAANAYAVAAADLNGDGKPDLIVAGSTVTPLLNGGAAASLGIAKTHTGNFSAGQSGATYSVVVRNTGTLATSGTVTVTDTMPSGLTPVSMAGTGWSCSGNSCTRSDALNPGASYSAIMVTVNVGADAPALVTNQVGVSGGGAGTASASDPTTILQPPAAPMLVSPANGATGVVQAPVLSWNAAAGAASYDVYFGTASSPPLVTNTTGTSYAPAALPASTTYYWRIAAKNSAGTTSTATWAFTTGTPPVGLRFVPVTPCRVVDTRSGSEPFGAPTMTAASSRSFPIPQSGCGIPNTAQAYSFNVTVVPKGPLPYLTLWPTGQSKPLVSTLNSFAGAVVANAAIVPAGTSGAVSVFVTDPTDVILDINGYFDTSTGATSYSLYPATPCRVADTRGATGQFGGPTMSAQQVRDFPVPLSSCSVPATARAYSLNVTVVPKTSYLGYLSTWPTGVAKPLVSTLNSWTGKVVANAALVPAGSNESISVFVTDPTEVILDINGYFGAPGGANALSFYPVTPCRVADTRSAAGPFGGPELVAQAERSFAVPASVCGIPSTAAAYSMNVTVVPDGSLSYLTAWPTGSARPLVSTLNSFDGSVVANAAIVPAGTNGAVSIFVTNATQVILDINGYFAP